MDNQKIIIESLAMDLKRMALGLYRGSFTMANRFKDESLKREDELEDLEINGYLKRLVEQSRKVLLGDEDPKKKAEDILMYSTLFQNFVLKKYKN